MSLDLVRNRPQFDLEILKPGVAIKYKYKNNDWVNAIIIKAECDKLTIIYYVSINNYTCSEDYTSACINLNDVLDESIEIKTLQ